MTHHSTSESSSSACLSPMASPAPSGVSTMLPARLAILALFLVHGLVVATWASRLPLIQHQLGLSSSQLGLLLLASAIGAITAMPITGKILNHAGSRMVGIIASLAFCLVLPALALASTPTALAAALFCFGFTAGAMDIAMNAQAVLVEQSQRKSMMVMFHAFFSVGGLLGAAAGSWVAARGIGPIPHFIANALLYSLLIGIASCFLLRDKPVAPAKEPLLSPFSWPLAGLCVIGFCCFLSEGAIIDWGGIYLYRILHASEANAALGYAFFSITMTIGRLLGDRLADRFGPGKLVLGGCALAGTGMTLLLLSHALPFALTGFLLLGTGFSAIVPMVFSASGQIPGNRHTNLTTITLFAYSAFLLGPPCIGLLAEWWSLRMALGLIILLVGLSAAFSRTAFSAASRFHPASSPAAPMEPSSNIPVLTDTSSE